MQRAAARCAARRNTTGPTRIPGSGYPVGPPSTPHAANCRSPIRRRAEIRGHNQTGQVRAGVKGFLDVVEELRPDDAAATPDGGQVARRDVPAEFGAAGLDLVEALSVGHDLGGVQRLADVFGERGGVGGLLAELARSQTAGGRALPHGSRESAGKHRFGDAGHRHTQVQRGLDGPTAGAFLLGPVHDDVDERFAGLGIGLPQHLGGDLDQVAVQIAIVPLGEHIGDRRRGQT